MTLVNAYTTAKNAAVAAQAAAEDATAVKDDALEDLADDTRSAWPVENSDRNCR